MRCPACAERGRPDSGRPSRHQGTVGNGKPPAVTLAAPPPLGVRGPFAPVGRHGKPSLAPTRGPASLLLPLHVSMPGAERTGHPTFLTTPPTDRNGPPLLV